ncbi:MAG: polyprenyl synthetase family protein [Actinomycetota bacterium]|nr:polyprenyl synthetase family protein [Actinomycetota bacterium]
MNALQTLADQLRAEDTPISPHVVDPTDPPQLGELAGGGEYALVVEAVREGYLLHYEQPRLLAGHDPDLALLAGDYLYALGLDRLAALDDTRAVAILSDLISDCARLQAEGETEGIPDLWRKAAERIAAGSGSVTQVTPPKQ